MDTVVEYERRGAAAWITLNRPEKLNAISFAVNDAVVDGLLRAERDDEVRVVVLAGAGKAFSAGHDLQEEVDAKVNGAYGWHAFLEAHQEVVRRLWACRKPLIAAVHGHCLGGGFEFALACDIIVATSEATFGHVEILYGSGPVTVMLPFLIHERKARELILTGDTIGAEEALEWGIINQVVEPEALGAAVARYVGKLAPTPVAVMRMHKLALQRASELKGMLAAAQTNVEISAILNSAETPEQRQFDSIVADRGLKEALAWRSARYASAEEASVD